MVSCGSSIDKHGRSPACSGPRPTVRWSARPASNRPKCSSKGGSSGTRLNSWAFRPNTRHDTSFRSVYAKVINPHSPENNRTGIDSGRRPGVVGRGASASISHDSWLGRSIPTPPTGSRSAFELWTKRFRGRFAYCLQRRPFRPHMWRDQDWRSGVRWFSTGKRTHRSWHNTWQAKGIPLGAGKEVFDAELTGIGHSLKLVRKIDHSGPVTVLLDSQAEIDRLRHLKVGPG
jgi:hypothetical protein